MRPKFLWFSALVLCLGTVCADARFYEIQPAMTDDDEEFERVANALKPGDELLLSGGVYSQTGRRAITANGTPEQPIIIRAAAGQAPLLTRPVGDRERFNNIEFVDCAHLVIRGLRFQGGSSGVRFIRGHHVTFEGCEVSEPLTSTVCCGVSSPNPIPRAIQEESPYSTPKAFLVLEKYFHI